MVGLLAGALIACGGEGGSTATASPAPPTTGFPPPAPAPPSPPPAVPASYAELFVAGDPNANIYDPSVEYEDQVGWLAYTSIDFSMPPLLHTEIARSDDRGLNWRRTVRANASFAAQLTETNGNVVSGVWRYEVASLVHVPDDIAAPWKLFTHRYFWSPQGDRLFQYGWIALRTANNPDGPWSAEVPLFGTNFTPVAPFSARLSVGDLDPSLADLLVITEPGTLYHQGVLYLSLSGASSSDGVDRIFLLASDDFGASWRYVGTPIARSDAQALSAQRYDGSSLVAFGGDIYLLATPERGGFVHDGTDIFVFEDIATGTLRQANGAPEVVNHIARQPALVSEFGAGQADYDEANVAGVLFPQRDENGSHIFHIFQTGRDILGR